MDKKMFCFQCEQTVGCTGCTGNAGVCGKKADTAKLQDELTGALISLAKAADSTETISKRTGQTIIEGLFTTVTNVSFDNAAIENMIQKVRAEKERLAPDCRIKEYDLQQLWNANEDIRSLKSLILFGIRGMAAYAYHANVLNYEDAEVNQFFCEALSKIGYEESTEALLSTVLKTGEINLKCMALLDKANTETYGTPEPTDVTLTVEKGPFIVVTGHDLKDLQLLLEQTEGKGINIYTHGEMLPAHSYPEFKKYEHFKGNYGNAWWKQNEEFEAFNGPILMTTNCIIPVRDSYRQRIFTTGVVGYDGLEHIEAVNGRKDFRCIIELAKHCPAPQQLETGSVIGGFAHAQVMALQDQIVEAVKNGDIRQFIVMAGCDGRHSTRSYYTDFARALPKDTVILTAGCAKYRYLKLDLGMINGIPRVLDAGQCNDSYSLVLIAEALKEAFGLQDINELPILYNIAWYEQKAVIVLLALLHLGVKNIHLGPTLPAFLSPEVVQWLKESYGIRTIQEVEKDMENFGITKREPSYGDMTMAELLKLDEGMEDVLYEAGFHCLGCPSSQFESLRDACELHALNVDDTGVPS